MSIRIIIDCSKNLMEGAFFPGELIRGKIILNFEKPIKARSVGVHYIGVENSYIRRRRTSGTGRSRTSHTVTYHDYHYYYHVEDILIEPGPGDDYIELKGESAHNFEFEIPEGVPGTFHIADSSIQYLIDVKVDIPKKSDIHKKAEIIILPNYIVKVANQEPYALLKSDGSFPQCELSCFSQVYREQENIEINLKIQKERNQKFREMELSLETISTKTARGYTDNYKDAIKIWKINKNEVYDGDSSFIFNYEIPYGVPYSIYGQLMRREIMIHLKIDRRFKSDKHLWLPIYILPAS
ncbi:MAG: hypothetical protein ACTSRG_13535 [Candidatus Helarchaeota archaeon]